jgi:hypothetical protein
VSSLLCPSIEAVASIEGTFSYTTNSLVNHFFYLERHLIVISILLNVVGHMLKVQFGAEAVEIRCLKYLLANFGRNCL